MHRRAWLALALCLVLHLGLQVRAAESGPIEFRKLPLEAAPDCLALTEDGGLLVVTHASVDRVSVWSMKTGERVKQFDCLAPRFALCRGDRAYIANYGQGTISVYSQQDWSLIDELQAGAKFVHYLSAPQGKFFKGDLLAIAGNGNTAPSGHVTIVDTKTDRHRELFSEPYLSVATVDYEGKILLCQAPIGNTPSAVVGPLFDYPTTAVLKGPASTDPNRDTRPEHLPMQGAHQNTPILAQTLPGRWWIGWNQVWQGTPPAPKGEVQGQFLIGDSARPQVYVFESQQMRCLSLPDNLAELGTRQVTYPSDSDDSAATGGANPPKGAGAPGQKPRTPPRGRTRATGRPTELFHDVAVTVGDRLSLAHFDRPTQSLWFASTEPFLSGAALAAAESAARGDNSPAWPKRVAAGKPIVFRLFPDNTKGTFAVMSGPKNLQLSESGELHWTPTKADVGEQQIKIKATINGKTSFVRLACDVIELAADLADDPAALAHAGPVALSDPLFGLEYSYDGRGMLLHDGDIVHLLDKSGVVVVEKHQFDRRYRRFLERPEYYVALAPKSITLIDKKTWKALKEIQLDYPQFSDMALNPAEKVCYLTIQDHPGLEVDETTGKVTEHPQLLGRLLDVDPQGHHLFSVIKLAYQDGFRFDEASGLLQPSDPWDEALLCYDIRGRAPRGRAMALNPGQMGSHLLVAPDGKNVSYVNRALQSGFYYLLPSYLTDNVEKDPVNYEISAFPTDLTYHPILDITACTNGTKIWFFRRSTGQAVQTLLDPPHAMPGIRRILFTPDGKRMMVAWQPKPNSYVLESVALTIPSADAAKVAAGYVRPGLVPRTENSGPRTMPRVRNSGGWVVELQPANIPTEEIEATEPAAAETLTPREIVKKYGESVVLIRANTGFGSGFVIGSKGYILTCAHVVTGIAEPRVQYRYTEGGAAQSHEVAATIAGLDRKNDLALLKIDPKVPLLPLRFAAAGAVVAGEDVTVIGNPGLGEQVLSKTVTTGVVSSPERDIDGVNYIQLSAAVNPGNSGGPMFNSHGAVIGVVTAKARIENTGFATPISSTLTFLNLLPRGTAERRNLAADSKAKAEADNNETAAPASPPAEANATPVERPRKWTNASGKSVEATLVKVEDGIAYLKRQDGTTAAVAVDRLSPADQRYLKGK